MHLGVCHMGAGGSADAMKFSDVLILVGIGILCAGFIMHGWVESVSLESGENAQPYQKPVQLLKGDEVAVDITCSSTSDFGFGPEEKCKGFVVITKDSEIVLESGVDLSPSDSISFDYKSDEYDSYQIEVSLEAGAVEINADVKRVFMLDFVVYPIGAAILLYGLQKRRIELSDQSIDAELQS